MKIPFALALTILAGCAGGGSEDLADLKAFMQELQARAQVPVEPLPPLRLAAPHRYGAGDKRSPFEPSVPLGDQSQPLGAAPAAPDLRRPRQPLERYSIHQIAMVGTLSKGTVRYALVQDGNGAVHRVGVGDYLGEDRGRIRHIDAAAILFVEIVPDGAGGWMERGRTLQLRQHASQLKQGRQGQL